MFSLTLAVGTHSWRLLYRDADKAMRAYKHAANVEGDFDFEDEFGQKVVVKAGELIGACLEDLDKSKMGLVEMALHQARTQNAATAAAQADPSLRAMRQNAGSPILSPMGGNSARPF